MRGVTWENLYRLKTRSAAVFWIHCNGLVAESSQEGVSVVQAENDQCLDQELHCILCEERPDAADVVEGKSA